MSGAHDCALPGCDLEGASYAFTDPGCRIVHGVARCTYCKGSDELVDGDGTKVVCRDCLKVFARFVTHPQTLGPGLLADLLEVHGEVLDIRTDPGGEVRWVWSSTWPR